jgi:EAL domain-containing protein (putative c-di-GMP-specific phosphodiesterase class I)
LSSFRLTNRSRPADIGYKNPIAARWSKMNWKSKRGGGEAAAETELRSENSPSGPETAFAREVQRAAREGRFHLDYQPLFSVRDEAPIGVEALLRLDTDSGRAAPGRFLPVLEASGMIGSVGEWVLTTAARELAGWTAFGAAPLLAVNVAAEQLEPGFAEVVLGALEAAGLPASRLCLELTHPARISDPVMAWAELRNLKFCGVRLFIDDFGTAGASIVDLKRFIIDAVKVDASFVHGLRVNGDDDAIVAALIGLAHSLGMQAVAEGVETQEQLIRLRDLGCDLAQGFLLGSPGPGPAMQRYFAAAPSEVSPAH